MATPILPGNPAGIASTTTAGTSAPSAQQVPAGPAMPAPAVRHVKRRPTASSPPPTLDQALQVVLGRLPRLDDYTAGLVLEALRAATRPAPPLERIEADLLRMLGARAPAAAAPAARIPPDMPALACPTVSAVVLRLVPRVAT